MTASEQLAAFRKRGTVDLLDLRGYNLRGLGIRNVLLGKNGCGKSRLLTAVEQAVRGREGIGAVRYISPERAGILQYDPNIERNLTESASWLGDSRRQNQAQQFRRQSAAQFRRLELMVLREIEKDQRMRQDATMTFDRVVDRINTLLDRVYLRRGDPAFVIHDRATFASGICGGAGVDDDPVARAMCNREQ